VQARASVCGAGAQEGSVGQLGTVALLVCGTDEASPEERFQAYAVWCCTCVHVVWCDVMLYDTMWCFCGVVHVVW